MLKFLWIPCDDSRQEQILLRNAVNVVELKCSNERKKSVEWLRTFSPENKVTTLTLSKSLHLKFYNLQRIHEIFPKASLINIIHVDVDEETVKQVVEVMRSSLSVPNVLCLSHDGYISEFIMEAMIHLLPGIKFVLHETTIRDFIFRPIPVDFQNHFSSIKIICINFVKHL